MTYSAVANGSAIGSGASVANQAGGVAVGSSVRAAVGTVNYVPSTAVGYKLRLYSCPSAGAAIASCQAVASNTGNGSASGKTVDYIPVAADLGRFLAVELEVISSTNGNAQTQQVTSDRAQDAKVVPGAATSARPAWSTTGAGWTPGGKAALVISPWTLPPALRQSLRSLVAWACDSAGAGQVAEVGFSLAGCTQVPQASILTDVNVTGASVAQVQTTAEMAGKYLLAQVNLVTTTGSAPYAFAIRSEAKQLGTAAAAPSASPSPTPTPSASTAAPDAGAAGTIPTGSPSAGIAGPVRPVMTIVAKREVVRGRTLGVAIELKGKGRGTTGNGTAMVELVKDPNAPKRVAKLKAVTVKKGKGFKAQAIGVPKGTYYVRVVYTDAGSGVQSAAVKRIRVR